MKLCEALGCEAEATRVIGDHQFCARHRDGDLIAATGSCEAVGCALPASRVIGGHEFYEHHRDIGPETPLVLCAVAARRHRRKQQHRDDRAGGAGDDARCDQLRRVVRRDASHSPDGVSA